MRPILGEFGQQRPRRIERQQHGVKQMPAGAFAPQHRRDEKPLVDFQSRLLALTKPLLRDDVLRRWHKAGKFLRCGNRKLDDADKARALSGQFVVDGVDMAAQKIDPRRPGSFQDIPRSLSIGVLPLRRVRQPRQELRRLRPEFQKRHAIRCEIP